MKKRDIKLFDKTIHEVKAIMTELAAERKEYHEESIRKDRARITRRRKHDKVIKNQIKECRELLNNLYKLFIDLSNGNGK